MLGCVGWKDAEGVNRLKLCFATGFDLDALQSSSDDGLIVDEVVNINNGFSVLAHRTDDTGMVEIHVGGEGVRVPVQPTELDLFADLNVILTERNGEPASVIADWMAYHGSQHGVRGVLLLDRGPSDPEFDVALAEYAAMSGLTRLVHLRASGPLGLADLPAATHPIHAPDAPGKDRMEVPENNPQSAPFGAFALYELLRTQFLEKAKAVALLDLSDILCPDKKPFEDVQKTASGVLQILGERIYPWRIRKGETPTFADHICSRFERTRGIRRWVAVPQKLGPQNIWRAVRITDLTPQLLQGTGFWRAMAVRHPDAAPSEIVAKTSLIEDDALLNLSKGIFGHKPVRPPESKLTKPTEGGGDLSRTCVVTTMKNEGPFILEWIAYHRAIGVTDFLVYTNDCTDGTDDMLELLQRKGLLQHRQNPWVPGGELKPQHAALQAAEDEKIVRDAGWVICMDVDEFINIHCGDGTLKSLFKAVGDANMISLTWRLFGNDDVVEFDDDFVISQFNKCAPELCRKPHQAWGFKTLFRNIGIYKKMGVHRPKGLKPDLWDQITWVNGSGKQMPRSLLRNGWRSTTDSYGYDLVTLNHYAVRSAESFLVKRDRGRVNHVDRDQGLSYWFRMNHNTDTDRSIHAHLPKLRAEYDRLMEDPEIAAAHALCVKNHRAKITELKQRPDYAAFFAQLTGTRLQKLSRMLGYFGANVFLAGPDVIPDDVVQMDEIPVDFFFTVAREETQH